MLLYKPISRFLGQKKFRNLIETHLIAISKKILVSCLVRRFLSKSNKLSFSECQMFYRYQLPVSVTTMNFSWDTTFLSVQGVRVQDRCNVLGNFNPPGIQHSCGFFYEKIKMNFKAKKDSKFPADAPSYAIQLP